MRIMILSDREAIDIKRKREQQKHMPTPDYLYNHHKEPIRSLIKEMEACSCAEWQGKILPDENKNPIILLKTFLDIYSAINCTKYIDKDSNDFIFGCLGGSKYENKLSIVKYELENKKYSLACHELHDLMFHCCGCVYFNNTQNEIVNILKSASEKI